MSDSPPHGPAEAGAAPSAGKSTKVELQSLADPRLEGPLPGTRLWFIVYVLWMAALAILARHWLAASDQGDPTALRAWLLALMCFYLSLCNFFIPMPTTWIVLLAASNEFALVDSHPLRIAIVAILGAAGTGMANLNEYYLLSYLLQFGLGRRVRRTRIYGWAIRWFDRAPFAALCLAGFIPIPVDALRWLAILRRYSRTRFALAYLVGRAPRYVILAWCSALMQLKTWQIIAIQAGLIAAAAAARLAWSLRRPAAQASNQPR